MSEDAQGIIYYESPFHATYSTAEADKICAEVDMIIKKLDDKIGGGSSNIGAGSGE